MRTILVRFYNPNDVMDVTPEITDEEIKEYCFRVNKYTTEQGALMAYAETPCTQWSTILDDSVDIKKWINDAYEHIKNQDTDWLEEHFCLIMDKPKLPKREEFPNLNDYLEAVSMYNQATSEPIIHAIPNFKIDDKDVQSWLRFNKEFGGKIIVVKHFTQQNVDDLRLLTELAFDGACVSESDEQLIKRVNQLADKIQGMV